MYSQGILHRDSADSTSKKSYRVLYILGFIEFIFISICLLLLLLNQYLNVVVDDYSPAYHIPDDDDADTTQLTTKTLSSSTTQSSDATSETTNSTNNPTTNIPSTTHSQENETVKIVFTMTQPQEEPTTQMLLTTTTTPSQEKPTSQLLIPTTQSRKEQTPKMVITTTQPPSTENRTTDVTFTSHTTDRESDTTGFFNNHSNTNNNSNLPTEEDKHKRGAVKRSELIDLKTEGKYLKTIKESAMENSTSKQNQDWPDLFISNLRFVNPSSKVKREGNFTEEKRKQPNPKTKLSHLLLMYPSCVSAIIILWMQMISRLTNDIMFKSTMILLITVCLALGITILAASIIESLGQRNFITILIAVSAAIFVVLEVIDFILLFIEL